MKEELLEEGLAPREIDLFLGAEEHTRNLRQSVRDRAHRLQWKVLRSFQRHGLSELHLAGSTGYGYGDSGRELLDQVLCDLFGAEQALLRGQFVSGTHAISCGLFGVLRPGDELVSITGSPYDTLATVIGHQVHQANSLRDWGIRYRQLELTCEGKVDLGALEGFLRPATRMVFLQRSRGYAWRPGLTIEHLGQAIAEVRRHLPQAVIMVDNCYGELVEDLEPTHIGADLVAGSLIKNLGGTLVGSGGYLAGKAFAVEAAAARWTAPGIGGEQGATLGGNRNLLQGLFLAPIMVGQALEGAIWASAFLESLGLEVSPRWHEPRTDLVQAVRLGTPEALAAFCRGIQRSGPVDSQAVPEAWVQPGYRDRILMAGGTFIAGSSLELSADGPMRDPYIAYLQGGVSLGHVQLGLVRAWMALKNLKNVHTGQRGEKDAEEYSSAGGG